MKITSLTALQIFDSRGNPTVEAVVTLADGQRYLSDQTWNDATIPLWHGAYDSDARRREMSDRTAEYDAEIIQD